MVKQSQKQKTEDIRTERILLPREVSSILIPMQFQDIEPKFLHPVSVIPS